MKPKKIFKEMNDQVKYELESAYLYLQMAAYFHEQGLDGMARWMRVQALEEQHHAMKFFDHLVDRGQPVKLQPLDLKTNTWKSPLAAFEAAYAHEQFISGRIHLLVEVANAEKDHAALPMLHWFLNEQIEEEANTSKIAQQLRQAEKAGGALFMIDRELGTRSFTIPPEVTIVAGAGGAGA